MRKAIFLMAALMVGFISTTFGQDSTTDNHTVTVTIPEVALVDVEPAASKNISMVFTAPTEAGLALTGTTNNALWLNYSSIKSLANPTRTVSVKLNEVIPGVNLKAIANADAGSGKGTTGTAGAQLTLTTADQTLVNGIGSCYTGDGANKGHNITYTLEVSSAYEDIQAITNKALTVTYTISN